MKIRNGFVSNSSSSSFIVAFPNKPTSVEEVKNMMFKDKTEHEGYPALQIAETVFYDFKEFKCPKNLPQKAIFAAICNAEIDTIIFNLFGSKLPNNLDEIETYLSTIKLIYEEKEEFFLKNHKNSVLSYFIFDDTCHYSSTLEHGRIFYNLPHLVYSHH